MDISTVPPLSDPEDYLLPSLAGFISGSEDEMAQPQYEHSTSDISPRVVQDVSPDLEALCSLLQSPYSDMRGEGLQMLSSAIRNNPSSLHRISSSRVVIELLVRTALGEESRVSEEEAEYHQHLALNTLATIATTDTSPSCCQVHYRGISLSYLFHHLISTHCRMWFCPLPRFFFFSCLVSLRVLCGPQRPESPAGGSFVHFSIHQPPEVGAPRSRWRAGDQP